MKIFALCCLVLFALPGTAAAEWQFTPFVGLTFRGSTSIADIETVDDKPASERVHKHFGGAVSFLGGGILGVETIFNWQGMGRLYFDAVSGAADEGVIVALTFIFTLMYVVARFVLDILYVLLDPRVRYT